MPETRTVKGFAEVGLPLAEGDFESVFLHLESGKECVCRFLGEQKKAGRSIL